VAIALFVKYGETASSSQAGSAGEAFFHWQTAAPVWEKLKPYAREMRKNPTPAEDALWQHLRLNQLGVKFRRQHAIGPFIVDFYAREARLIIEVDGPIHEKQKEYDEMRQAYLESLGYRVVRFTNEQVLQNIDAVLAILQKVLSRPHPPAPSPYMGKGNPPSPQAMQANPPSPQAMQANPPSPQAMQANPPSPQAMQANPPSPQAGRGPGGRVYHAHLYGSRADKYAWLDAHDLSTAGYQPITPESPSYFFTPRQTQNLQTYQSWPSVTEIFPVNSVGIVTARDNLTIRWTPDEMWTTVLTFSQLSEELARTAFQLGKDARDWKVSLAQQDVKRDGGPHREKIVPILYRPFDVRYTYYTGRSRGFHCMPRPEVMRHMLAGENLALITHKREELDVLWSHALVTNYNNLSMVSSHQKQRTTTFPSTSTPLPKRRTCSTRSGSPTWPTGCYPN
jgi:very-short-patch-repair endonuclease